MGKIRQNRTREKSFRALKKFSKYYFKLFHHLWSSFFIFTSNTLLMKLKFLTLFILLFFAGMFTKAQLATHTLVTVGYEYQNSSFAEVGGKLLFLSNDDLIFRLGASGLFGVVNGKFAAIPKIQGDILINTQKQVDIRHSYYFLAGAEVTSKYIAPKAGISIFGIVDLTAGYAFSFDKEGVNGKELKGFNLNFTINIPTVAIKDLAK